MAQLLVRGLENDVVRELKLRAARRGTSAEEEHRRILREVLGMKQPPRTLKDLLLEIPEVGEDADFERTSDLGRPVDL
ncbi:MAG: DNA-binding protein [Actinobacteria bacterium]|nr:DNA-binding protein [Actinomycetota bacterium]